MDHSHQSPESEPIRVTALREMPVVSMAGGVKLGNVHDVAIDPEGLRVYGLVLAADQQAAVVPFEKVLSVGPDAVTVERFEAAPSPEEGERARTLHGISVLVGLPVVDAAGTLVGELTELLADRRGGRLTALVAQKGGVLGLGAKTLTLPAESIRSLGPKIVTVERAIEEARASAVVDAPSGT
jgi:uncharacterized protein YrrD